MPRKITTAVKFVRLLASAVCLIAAALPVMAQAPGTSTAARAQLLELLQNKSFAQAITVGIEAVVRWPQDAEIAHYLGLAYFQSGQLANATRELGRAADLAPANYDVQFDTSLALLEARQYAAAAEHLARATKMKPGEPMAHLLLGRAYQNSNRTLSALNEFKTALRLQPDLPLGHYHLAFAYQSLGDNATAIAEYNKELLRSPTNAEVLYHLGHVQLEQGDLTSAAANLRKAVASQPRADAFYDLGKALSQLGQNEQAQHALRQAASLDPSDPSPHYQLARLLKKTGDSAAAEREMQVFAQLSAARQQAGGMASGRNP